MNERRIARIQELIKARVAQVLQRDLADPSAGMITITRVKVDRELMSCKIYWSVLGTDSTRKVNEAILKKASSFVRTAIAKVLNTRTVPKVNFIFDESIRGAIRIQEILREVRGDRSQEPEAEGPADNPSES